MSNARRFRRRLMDPAVYVLPDIGDDQSPALKNALAVRNAASTSGRCACGAEVRLVGNLRPGEVSHLVFEHEDDCPASDDAIAALVKEGGR